MNKSFIIVLLLCSNGLFAQKKPIDPNLKAAQTFSTYCSSCHGEKIEAFVDRQWKHGKSKAEIINTITNGVENTDMISWKNTLKKEEIDNIAEFMTTSLKNVDQYNFNKAAKQSVYQSGKMTITLDTIATGFDSPWGLTQLPSGELLITDRAGFLYKVDKNKNKILIKNTPEVLAQGQGGLLDVEIHPDYVNNGWVYLSYSKFKTENDKKLSTTAIVRGKIKDNTFVDQQEIFEALPYQQTRHHYGSRLLFDGKGHLFFSVGERGKHFEYAQSTEADLGKIHRIYDDGRIPEDNPFYNKAPNRPSIWTWGNRNQQGMTLEKSTGLIWETEHGPRGGDEINIIKKATNYGWPVISYGINYDGKPITNISKKDGMEQPIYYYIPSIAPSGTAFQTSDKYPEWKNDLLIGSLRFNYLERVTIKDKKVVANHKELINVGRLRNVKLGSDGYIYIGIENPGMVFRLIPSH